VEVEAVDFFYLSMPQVLDIGDGSQDALLVRVAAGGGVGYGECEAAPLPSIAALVCPMSHSACKPVQASVLGAVVESPDDIRRIGDAVRANSLDLLQADHTLSGIDMALWDLLGRRLGEPVWKLLGWERSCPKTPYASVLFGDTPAQTLDKARAARARGFAAVKFGWGPYGRAGVQDDDDQLAAAREGLGDDAILLVDAGTVWVADVERARAALPALKRVRATWLEEPFVSGALDEYRTLARDSAPVGLAGAEGSHNFFMAKHMIDHGALHYVQIDAGRVGGISVATQVARYADMRGVTYVNHTFTSHLALSASIQPYAGLQAHAICEYPAEPKRLALDVTRAPLLPDRNGQVRAPDAPGLGVEVNLAALRPYLVDTEIRVAGRTIYRTPPL
jgi:L-alanine-DL-glutamate epimerase-like enolase superfamily enzyme